MIPEEDIKKTLTSLARKMGEKNASALLSVLGKDKQFVDAIETTVGQELLKDAVLAMENIIRLVLVDKDTKKDRAELKAYKEIIHSWQGRIANYNKNRETFTKNSV
jgi:hypothetical protein